MSRETSTPNAITKHACNYYCEGHEHSEVIFSGQQGEPGRLAIAELLPRLGIHVIAMRPALETQRTSKTGTIVLLAEKGLIEMKGHAMGDPWLVTFTIDAEQSNGAYTT